MRKRIVKRINKKVDSLLLEWLKTLVSEEEAKNITPSKLKTLLPKDRYFASKRTYYLSFYTQRWAKQNIKKLLKRGKILDAITLEDLKWLMTKRKHRL
tara:strand:- start:2259 stop:2552 length:294 start_codon:yes stop_codon:yes gene_type:complete